MKVRNDEKSCISCVYNKFQIPAHLLWRIFCTLFTLFTLIYSGFQTECGKGRFVFVRIICMDLSYHFLSVITALKGQDR